MKNIVITLGFVFLALGCKAQTPIFDLSDRDGTNEMAGAYYKDTQNRLNSYVGTYIYNQNGKMFKIVLQKKEQSFRYYYEDLIIGEYQYIENGVEKINTLSRLNTNFVDGIYYSIHGNLIMSSNYLCDDCLPSQNHLGGSLSESSTQSLAEVDFKLTTVNGQPAMRVLISWRYKTRAVSDSPNPQPSFPGGEYIMIKQ